MEFRILGLLEVVDGERLIELRGRKLRAVLAMLLVSPNEAVSVDRLADGLWGEDHPGSAANMVQGYVSQLRKFLGAELIRTRSPGYVLAAEPDSIDASRFERLVRLGRAELAEGRPGAAADVLGEALALWRGEALADFAFEPFAQPEIVRLSELRVAALEEHAEAELMSGRHAQVATSLRSLVDAHPLRERMWGQLITALYRSGRQAEALRAFGEVRRRLAEELGIEPGSALKSLERDVLLQNAALDWAPVSPTPAMPRTRQPIDHSPDLTDQGTLAIPTDVAASEVNVAERNPGALLVGRGKQVRHLESAFAETVRGAGRVVLVAGEPGIGKTRLAEELVARTSASADVAWGRCSEREGAPAFWPWMQVVDHLSANNAGDRIRAALGGDAAVVAQIVPEVRELVPGLGPPVPLEPDAARFRLYDSLAAFLCRLAAGHPLVIVLDDLQWADPPSLQVLGHLAGRIAQTRVLVLATYRDVDPVVGPPLSETLADLARQRVTSRLSLTGLAPADVGRFIASTTGVDPSAALVATVHDRTEGNPFVGELVQLVQVTGASTVAGPDEAWKGTVPLAVRDVIRRRVSRLPAPTAALLGMAAVAGREVDLEVLTRVSDLSRPAVLDALEPALDARVVVETPASRGHYRFSHALVNETLYEGIGAVRRARLHRRVGEALEELHGPNDEIHLGVLAHHFFHAVPASDTEKGYAYALRASEWAQARLAYEQAHEQLRRALELVAADPDGPDRQRRELEVVLRLASLLTMTKGYGALETGETWARARKLCDQLGETGHVGPVLYGLIAYQLHRACYDVAREVADELLEIATRSGRPTELVAAHQAVGVTAQFQGQLQTGRTHLERAVALTGGSVDRDFVTCFPFHPVVGCWTFLSQALWLAGEGDRARDLMRDAVALAARIGHDLTMAHALDFVAWMAALDHDVASARAASERVLEFAAQKGFPLYVGLNAVLHGWARALEGDAEAGVAEIEAGLSATEAAGSSMLATTYLGFLAEAQQRANRPDDALASVNRALQLVEATGERFWKSELHRLKAELLLVLSPDRLAEARKELSTALEVAHAQGAKPLEDRARRELATISGCLKRTSIPTGPSVPT